MPNLRPDMAPRDPVRDVRLQASKTRRALQYVRSTPKIVGRAALAAGESLILKGGGALVIDGGTVRVIRPGQAEGDGDLMRIGDMPYGDRGLEFTRDNGATVLSIRRKNSPDEQQSWSFYDAAGNEIVAEQQFLKGLAKPYLEHPFQPVAAASGTPVVCGPFGFERSTSSGTFETLFVHDGKRQNGFIDLKVAAVCSDGSTAGEVQVVNLADGSPLPGFTVSPWLGVIPAGTTSLTVIDPTPSQAGLYVFSVQAQMRIGVQVRVTAGTGSITLAIAQAIGG